MITFKPFFYPDRLWPYGLKANRTISNEEEIEIDIWCKDMLDPRSYISIPDFGYTKMIGFRNETDRMLFIIKFNER